MAWIDRGRRNEREGGIHPPLRGARPAATYANGALERRRRAGYDERFTALSKESEGPPVHPQKRAADSGSSAERVSSRRELDEWLALTDRLYAATPAVHPAAADSSCATSTRGKAPYFRLRRHRVPRASCGTAPSSPARPRTRTRSSTRSSARAPAPLRLHGVRRGRRTSSPRSWRRSRRERARLGADAPVRARQPAAEPVRRRRSRRGSSERGFVDSPYNLPYYPDAVRAAWLRARVRGRDVRRREPRSRATRPSRSSSRSTTSASRASGSRCRQADRKRDRPRSSPSSADAERELRAARLLHRDRRGRARVPGRRPRLPARRAHRALPVQGRRADRVRALHP